ncbi:MAG: protein-glutamate O-methyltransferase [Pseudomonadota bacterium]
MNAALQTSRRHTPSMVEGEFPFTAQDFKRIAAFLHEQSGIFIPETKATLVYSRLAKRLRLLGLANFEQYCALLDSGAGEDERNAMIAALTTNVTRFFREPHHFDHLRDEVLPALVARAKNGGRVRIWSSACSSGQEPYSIALTLLALMPDAERYDVRILATDIDPNVVATAKEGLYNDEAIEPIPRALRDRWMKRENNEWRVGPEARALISFRELNLIGQWPMKGKFDAIFCRNVVIYFEEATQNRVWTRFRDYLAPAGRLYVGHSERIDVAGFATDGLTIYRLTGRA